VRSYGVGKNEAEKLLRPPLPDEAGRECSFPVNPRVYTKILYTKILIRYQRQP